MGYFDDIPEAGGSAANLALASTFADPADVRRYREARAAGATESQALAVGDNGVSAYGDDTTSSVDPIVALPPDTPGFAHNRFVELTGPDGRSGIARVSEKMPATAKLKGNATIDLNPGAARLIGHPGGVYPVSWRFIDQPEENNGTSPADYFADIPAASLAPAAPAAATSNRGGSSPDYFADIETLAPSKRLEERPATNPRGEEIKAAPHFLEELKAGRIGSAYYLAKNFLENALAPTQENEPGRGRSLLGTTEQIAAHPDDSLPVRAAKAIVNVGNRTMAAMTSPEMLPLLPIAGGEEAAAAALGQVPSAGRIVSAAFAASQIPQIPGAIKRAIDSPTGSQAQFENVLDGLLLSGFTIGAGKHAIKGSPAGLRATVREEPAIPDLRRANDAEVTAPIETKPELEIANQLLQRQREAAAPAEEDPVAIASDPATNLPPTDTQVAGAPVVSVPSEQIASRPELMQFKRMDDAATGENAADEIATSYDALKAGNLLLWQPNDPTEYGLDQSQHYIVANGHHRNAAAQKQGVQFQNAQILPESAGFSPGDARAIAAEANIADGKGTIYDQTKFLRERAATFGPDEALGRARQIGARGEKAATIALSAGPDLYASFVNEQITPDQTVAIARHASGNDSLQRLGIQRAAQGDSPNDIGNFLQAVQAKIGREPAPTQVDLFGADDTALRQAQQMAKRAGAIQREISDQINAVAGAARRPEKAAALGVNVSDPGSVNAKLAGLQMLRERAKNWAADVELRAATLTQEGSTAEVVARLQNQRAQEALDPGNRVSETFRGNPNGNAADLRRPTANNPTGAPTPTSGRSIPQLYADVATRSEALRQNRESLARYIEAAGAEDALRAAGVGSSRALEYARESLRQFADGARSGFLPPQPYRPIYRGDFEANRAAYTRASDYAFGTVQRGLRELGLSPAEDIHFSSTAGPRLRSGEKGTADLFQENDQPFNLAGETGIDYSGRQSKEIAAQRKIEEATKAQDAAQGRLFAQGSSPPRLPPPESPQTRAYSPLPGSPAAPPPALRAIQPLRAWWREKTLGARKLVAPQTIDDHALKVANVIREYNGVQANRLAQTDAELAKWRTSFDQTPVPPRWTFEEDKPLPRNYAFIDESERGGRGLTANEVTLKNQLAAISNELVDRVHEVAPSALKTVIQDYFPHVWGDPKKAQRVFADIFNKRPLEGSKSFLKKRSLEYFRDGLRAGLVPVSDNPIDLWLTKIHEVQKFIAAQNILREAKEIGARKFVYVFEQPPEGWVRVEDPSTAVHAPPFVTVPEAFDAQMRTKTAELLNSLGIPTQRLASLGGRRWGTFQEGGAGIRTKFAGPLSVYWHELGHGLQERYRWIDQIMGTDSLAGRSPVAAELRNLADLRLGEEPTKSFRKYVRSKDEKAAVMLEAYVHAPDRMKVVAPTIYARVRQFIADRPELHPINDIRPSLALGEAKQKVPIGGMVTLGHYYMPEGAAAVLKNYLSPGLGQYRAVRTFRTLSNVMNQAQLGMSAFHAGFTSLDAIVSTWALGLRNLSEGKILRGASRIGLSPFAPVANYFTGKAIQNEMLRPGSGEIKVLGLTKKLSPAAQAAVESYAKLAVQSGLRATTDPFWKTQVTRNMIRAWHEGGVRGYAGTILRLPFAISEQLMRPILETLVPRQKLGVFAGMAEEAMNRLGPEADIHAVRAALARAADATEDRMGQMTYDNLFYNRVVKDAALSGFRAYGWTLGKYRAILGGIADTIRTSSRIAAGEPVLTDRMAYLIALPMVTAAVNAAINYGFTGQAPQDWRDLAAPRTGRLDANGNPQRIVSPTYVKEWLSDWHDFPDLKKVATSFAHKLNPAISIAFDLLRNADYSNTKIFNEDDPWLKQQWDKVAYVAKSMEPFAITGAAKLSKSKPGLAELALPFFGFVPAKASLTMTPAQLQAAELMRERLPAGARTQDQAAHGEMMKTLMQDLRENGSLPDLQPLGSQLRPGDVRLAQKRAAISPFEYQVEKLGVDDAMKVWDLASPRERAQLKAILSKKLQRAQTVPGDRRARYWRILEQQ